MDWGVRQATGFLLLLLLLRFLKMDLRFLCLKRRLETNFSQHRVSSDGTCDLLRFHCRCSEAKLQQQQRHQNQVGCGVR